jgi:acetolactate synthase-1/2/3 large subunit
LACGVPWIAAGDVRPLVAACDAFLAVGTRFNAAFTANWNLPLPEKTIRIDIDAAEIERNLPMQHKLVGDAGLILAALDNRLATLGIERQGQVDAELAKAQRAFRQQITAKAGKTTPWMHALRAALPRDGILACDMSLFWADMLALFPVYQPRAMLFPWGFGTLGFAIPEAIGAKLAYPDRAVVAIVGDGGFLFTGAELATAVQYKLNIPILVPNNHAYGMIKVQQRDQYDEQFMAVDLTNPDYVALAQAFGARGVKVTTPTAMAGAISQALTADKPTVIEIPWGWTWGSEG